MNPFEVIAEPRAELGTNAGRRLRKEGKIPAVAYGLNKKLVSLSLWHHTFARQLELESFYSRILTLKVGDKNEQVILKDIQRHPYKSRILHVDFQYISDTKTITMRVPIHFLNEEDSVGVKQEGGTISHIVTDIEVQCLPKNIPEYIEIDLAELSIGETIHMKDVKLPKGVENYSLLHGGDPEQAIVSVHLVKAIADEDPVEATSEEQEEEESEEK